MSSYVPPSGSLEANYIIVGEQPGRQEVFHGKPFIGPAGKEKDICVSNAGINSLDIYLTNTIKDLSHNLEYYINKPQRKEVQVSPDGQEYIDILRNEIKNHSAKVVFCMGNVALFALTGRWGITKWRGSILKIDEFPGKYIIPTFHPATIIPPKNQFKNRFLIIRDFKKGRKIVEGSYIPTQRELIIRPSYKDVINFLAEIKEKSFNYIAYDIEVGGEGTEKQVTCISFSRNMVSMSIPFIFHNSEGKLANYFRVEEELTIWNLVKDILENKDIPKVGQNLTFDGHFNLLRYGICPQNLHDTMILQHLIMPDYPKGLDFITSLWTDHPYYKADGKDFFKGISSNWDRFWMYNAIDSIICDEVFPILLEEVKKLDNISTYERTRKAILPIVYMMYRGLKIDRLKLLELMFSTKNEISNLETKLNNLAGFNCNSGSSKDIKKLLDGFGVKDFYKTKKGNYKFDNETLTRYLRKGISGISEIKDIRKKKKQLSTYLVEDKIDNDDRLRCSYNVVGTMFSRLSSSESIFGKGMNAQNWPHSLMTFVTPDNNYVVYELDYSQAENRIVAYISRCAPMIETFEKGYDVHKLTAALIFGKPVSEISDEPGSCKLGTGEMSERDWGKRGNHSLNYGFGYKSFALKYELTETEAKRIVEGYHRAYPEIRLNFHSQVIDDIKRTRTITNLMGRSILFRDRLDYPLYQNAFACIPQGTVGDMINERGLNFIYYNEDDDFRCVEILKQTHDSITIQIPLSISWKNHEKILYKIKKEMELPICTKYGREFIIPADILMMKCNLNKEDKKNVVKLKTISDLESAYNGKEIK